MKTLSTAALAALVLQFSTEAQETAYAASETLVARAGRVGASGARSTSASYETLSQLAGAPIEGSSISAGFVATGAIVSIGDDLAGGAPVVVGAEPRLVDASGGDTVRLFGVHLEELGGGLPSVQVAGSTATVSSEQSTHLDVVVPTGYGSTGNPLGPVDVEVETLAGAGVGREVLLYTPGLDWLAPLAVGELTGVGYRGQPGELVFLLWGNWTPGAFAPVPPFTGSLELIPFKFLVNGAFTGPTGGLDVTFPIPDSPELAGYTLHMQALSLTSESNGSFTNRIHAVIGG